MLNLSSAELDQKVVKFKKDNPSTNFFPPISCLHLDSKKVREKSRECHNHKPQPFTDPKRKRKPTNLNKHKLNKRTKSTKISSLFPKRGNRNTKRTEEHKNKMTHGKTYNKSSRRINHKATKSKTNTWTTALERSVEQTTGGFKALLQLTNFTLGPDATLNTEMHKNSVRIKAPNSVNASKRKHKNHIDHYNKQRRVLMANSTVCTFVSQIRCIHLDSTPFPPIRWLPKAILCDFYSTSIQPTSQQPGVFTLIEHFRHQPDVFTSIYPFPTVGRLHLNSKSVIHLCCVFRVLELALCSPLSTTAHLAF